MLYPAELQAHMLRRMPPYSSEKKLTCQQIAAHFLTALPYTIQNEKKGGARSERVRRLFRGHRGSSL